MSSLVSSNLTPDEQSNDPFYGTNYRMVSFIGSGGMGDVYVVEHRTLSMKYAAKILRVKHATDKRTVDRMRLEAEALAKLDHKNIVGIHAYAETPKGLPFIVMDLLRGQTLRDLLLERGPIPVRTALIMAVDILNGLEEVHQLGIVHRDLKPSNLFLHTDTDDTIYVKLLDFGAARVIPGVSEDSPAPLILPTRTGTAVGTPMFMSPEAASGRAIDIRTDIYAVANIIYLMLTGHGPFDDQGDLERVLKAHVTKKPPPISKYGRKDIPATVERVVAKGLEKDPANRYQSAYDFGKCIYDILMAPDPNSSVTKGDLPKKTRSPRPAQVVVLLLLLLATVALGHALIQRTLR